MFQQTGNLERWFKKSMGAEAGKYLDCRGWGLGCDLAPDLGLDGTRQAGCGWGTGCQLRMTGNARGRGLSAAGPVNGHKSKLC